MPESFSKLRMLNIGIGILAFYNSFLMFFLQPMVAKALLPAFGGSAAVWTTVMLFFQLALVAGYGVTHLLSGVSGKRMVLLYGALLVSAWIGCRMEQLFSVEATQAPTQVVLVTLLLTVGLPFLLLSATTPLLQMVINRFDSREPYWLYGVSNVASLGALLCYPVLIEPQQSLKSQTELWTWSFYLLALALFMLVIFLSRGSQLSENKVDKQHKVEGQVEKRWDFGWFLYPMLASVAFLAFTAHLTADVAPVPLLWVLPLSVYLFTFVLVFARKPRYWPHWTPFLCLLGCMVQALPQVGWGGAPVSIALPIGLFCLFLICWFCHGKLIGLRPEPEGLTRFYLALSIGGSAGGLFCGVVAPLIFPDAFEMPLILLIVGLIACYETLFSERKLFHGGGLRFLWKTAPFCAVGLLIISVGLWFQGRQQNVLAQERNFYGSVRIRDCEGVREMVHGRVLHGVQLRTPEPKTTPVAYYYSKSAVASLFTALQQGITDRGLKIGAIGLGVGTIASFTRSGDKMVFIELDEKIEVLARNYFTFLAEAPGDVRVEIGDGRQVVGQFEEESLDVLLIDAFTGDSVPAHLLTSEAFDVFAAKVRLDGFMVFHISNQHLNLSRLMAGLAQEKGWKLDIVDTKAAPPYGAISQYAVFSRQGNDMPEYSELSTVYHLEDIASPVLWTDQRSNLLQIMIW